MIYIRKNIAILLLSLVLMIPGQVSAQSKPGGLRPPVVVVLDMKAIQNNSAAGKAWQLFINKRRKIYKDQILTEENTLRSAWEKLTRQRSILAPEAFQQRERAFREKETAAKRKIARLEQALKKDLRTTLVEVRKSVERKMRPILTKITKDKGIDIIMLKQDMVRVGKNYNITADILKELDKSLPTLNVEALSKKARK